MKKYMILSLMALLFVGAVSALAADIDGKWISQTPGRDGTTREVTYTLKADGATLTGTMSTGRGESQIVDGKINGSEISFAIVQSRGGEERRREYTGKLAGDELTLTVETPMGSRETVAKRAK